MVDDLLPIEVDAHSADRGFWTRYHAYRRARQLETRPDEPVLPDDVEEQRMRHDQPFDIIHRYEIARGGEMISWFGGSTTRPGAPGYEQNRRNFNASFSVCRDLRRHGIGRSWLPLAVELMERHGCTVVTSSSDEESGNAFLKWLGAEPKLTETESRLRFADVDWAMVRRWIAEGPISSPRTTLEIYDGHIPDSMLDEYAFQLMSLLNTMPFDDLDHGEIVVTPAHLRNWSERMDLSHEVQHTVLTREPDGVISGMTDVSWAPYRPAIVHQRFTGVRPDARGRGIGKWIKAVMVDRIHRLYPDAEWISTANAASNAPMLAINRRLGFKPYRTSCEFQMTRDQLAARIRELAAPS